jgi:TonB family protein
MRVPVSVAVALVLGAAKPPPVPVDLQPATAWKVDYSKTSCILTRQFTGAGQAYDFELTLAPIEKRAWLRIGSAEKVRKFDDGDAIVEVDGAKLAEPTHFNIFENAKHGTTREFLFLQFRRDVAPANRSLRLRPARHGDLMLQVPDFPGAMRAMDSCMDDLHRSLGVDPAVLQTIATNPEGWAFQFVRSPDREYEMQLLYWVTAEGKVDDCRILKPSGIADFDQRFCEELKRNGRFKPAKSVAGAPVRAPVFEDLVIRREERITTEPLAPGS